MPTVSQVITGIGVPVGQRFDQGRAQGLGRLENDHHLGLLRHRPFPVKQAGHARHDIGAGRLPRAQCCPGKRLGLGGVGHGGGHMDHAGMVISPARAAKPGGG
ncbi:MAG: hypothetical protein NXH79_07685 [Rhodobacteraceae bacterium]|nr:hypothetical protein [Paracoccaceae bacterium]